MTINENSNPAPLDQTPLVRPGTYSPVMVHIQDSFGAIFLGILSVILLIGWLRAERRNRLWMEQKST